MCQDLPAPRNAVPGPDRGCWTLRFEPVARAGRTFAFPCDPEGRVDLDAMSERARNNYFYARVMRGRELAYPSVRQEVHGPREAGEV